MSINFAANAFTGGQLADRVAKMIKSLHREYQDHIEMHERLMLENRPWAEDYLHWVHTDTGWQLHGHLVPPRTWRQASVTRQGWCLGQRRI